MLTCSAYPNNSVATGIVTSGSLGQPHRPRDRGGRWRVVDHHRTSGRHHDHQGRWWRRHDGPHRRPSPSPPRRAAWPSPEPGPASGSWGDRRRTHRPVGLRPIGPGGRPSTDDGTAGLPRPVGPAPGTAGDIGERLTILNPMRWKRTRSEGVPDTTITPPLQPDGGGSKGLAATRVRGSVTGSPGLPPSVASWPRPRRRCRCVPRSGSWGADALT